jgi:hypothetical protein
MKPILGISFVCLISILTLSSCSPDKQIGTENVDFNVNTIFCTLPNYCILAGFSGSNAKVEVKENDHYSVSKIPNNVVYVTSVNCPTSKLCFATSLANYGLSYAVLESNDAGRTWQFSYSHGYTGPQGDISCVSASFCMTPATVYENLSPQIMEYKNGSWSTVQVSSIAGHIDWVTCTSSGFCALSGSTSIDVDRSEYNVGLIAYTSDFGNNFTLVKFPYLTNINLVSCHDSRNGANCMAAGYNYANKPYLLSDQNAGFKQTPVPVGFQSITSLNCSSQSCYLGGITWQNSPIFAEINYRANKIEDSVLSGRDAVEVSASTCILKGSCIVTATTQTETSSTIYNIALNNLTSTETSMQSEKFSPYTSFLTPVVVAGDSVALTLDFGATDAAIMQGYSLFNAAIIGCGIMGEIVTQDEGFSFGNGLSVCNTWQEQYSSAVQSKGAKVAILLVGRWEVANEIEGHSITHIGDPSYDNALYNNLVTAIKLLSNKGKTKVVVLTCPYFFSGYKKSGVLWPEDLPSRVQLFNKILRQAAGRFNGVASVFDLNEILSIKGKYARVISGIPVRTEDGIHLTERGAQFIASSLLPYLTKILAR